MTSRDFEDFCFDLLSLGPTLTLDPEVRPEDGTEDKVVFVQYVEKPGIKQGGRDLLVKTAKGRTWAIECKHPEQGWSDVKTKKALQEAVLPADRHFLWISTFAEDKFRQPLKGKPWELWGSRQISSLVRSYPEKSRIAAILEGYFNPETVRELTGEAGSPAMVTPKRFFDRFTGSYLKYDSSLQGRQDLLQKMLNFVFSEKERVLIIEGAVGLGKSRLLKAFSDSFQEKSVHQRIRFFWEYQENFGQQLDRLGKNAVVVWDDLHRESVQTIRAVIKAFSIRDSCKLVLASRPRGLGLLREILEEEGFSSAKVRPAISLKSLRYEEAVKLAEEILGSEHRDKADFLGNLSRDCPLIAVVGGCLIKEKKLSLHQVQTDPDIINQVWRKFHSSVQEILEQGRDRSLVRKLIPLVAILSPIRDKKTIRSRMAEWLKCSEEDINHCWEDLKKAGLVLGGREDWRLIPDAFSDYLVYEACYDANGESKNYVEPIAEAFGDLALAEILQNVASCEWLARNRFSRGKWETVSDRIWQMFVGRLENASWFKRDSLIKEWSKSAFFLPEKTLDLVEILFRAKEPEESDQEEALDWEDIEQWEPGNSLAGVAPLLRSIAVYHYDHPSLGKKALDLLWKIAQRKDKRSMVAIEELTNVGRFKRERPIEVNLFYLRWLEQKLAEPLARAWLEEKYGVIASLFRGIFEKGAAPEEGLLKRNKILQWNEILRTRKEALRMLKDVSDGASERMLLGILHALHEAMDSPAVPVNHRERKSIFEFWEPHRKEAFEVVKYITASTQSRATLIKAREQVRESFNIDIDSPLLTEVKMWFKGLPNDLDLEIGIVLTADSREEEEWPIRDFDGREPDYYERKQKLWLNYQEDVANRLLKAHSKNRDLYNHLEKVFEYYLQLGFTVTPWHFLDRIGSIDRGRAFVLGECLLGSQSAGLKTFFHCLFNNIEPHYRQRRFILMQAAAKTGDIFLANAVISGYNHWRDQGLLPEEKAWLIEFSRSSSKELFPQWIKWIEHSRAKDQSLSYDIFGALAIDQERPELVCQALGWAARYAEQKPPSGLVAKILTQFISVPKFRGGEIERGVANLAELYPRQLYDFFSARIRFKEVHAANNAEYEPIGWFIEDIRLSGLANQPDAEHLRKEAFLNSLDGESETRHHWRALLQMAWIRGDDDFPKYIGDQLGQIATARALLELAGILGFNHSRVAVNCPDLVKKILERAKAFGKDCIDEITEKLIFGIERGGRSFTNGEMDDKTVLDAATELAVQYREDEILGPFYNRVVDSENEWIQSVRRQCSWEDE